MINAAFEVDIVSIWYKEIFPTGNWNTLTHSHKDTGYFDDIYAKMRELESFTARH